MITRRAFLGTATGALASAAMRSHTQPPAVPIIDTHIHLFDPTRPQGAPYSGPRIPGTAAIPAYPDRYRALAAPLGIVGAVKVEASPWIEDNLWVLEVARRDPIIVGVIGNLQPEKPEFAEYLGRYQKNPLFRGIRYGNLWNRDLAKHQDNPDFISGLKLLADGDLVLDTANPRISLLEALVRISEKVPNLRIVLDHLPALEPTPEEQPKYDALLKELAARPQVFVKLSQIVHRVNGQVSTDLAAHKPRLDLLSEAFGEDRVMFGSDWPNSDGVTTLDKVVAIAKAYYDNKPVAAREKYFSRNSIKVYKWIKREASQPGG